eukprot:g33.t1
MTTKVHPFNSEEEISSKGFSSVEDEEGDTEGVGTYTEEKRSAKRDQKKNCDNRGMFERAHLVEQIKQSSGSDMFAFGARKLTQDAARRRKRRERFVKKSLRRKPSMEGGINENIRSQKSASNAVNTLRKALVQSLSPKLDEYIESVGTVHRFRPNAIDLVKSIVAKHPKGLKERGTVGETILHQCLIFLSSNDRLYYALSHFFIRNYSSLVNCIYESANYYGESALHLCVVQDLPELFESLVEEGANVSARANGCFFLPYPQCEIRDFIRFHEKQNREKRNHPSQNFGEKKFKKFYFQKQQPLLQKNITKILPLKVAKNFLNSKCFVYYGEYVLSFAACCGSISMVKVCLDSGADINAQDIFGNSVLHALVHSENKYGKGNLAKMYPLLIERGANVRLRNKAGFTPLGLAALMGNVKVFDFLLQNLKEIQWQYGPVTCFTISTGNIDSVDHLTGKTAPKNVLTIATNEKHLELLGHPMLHRLLEEKWKTVIRGFYLWDILLLIVHLLLLSGAVFTRRIDTCCSGAFLSEYNQNIDYARLVFEILCVLSSLRIARIEVLALYETDFSQYFGETFRMERSLLLLHILAILTSGIVRFIMYVIDEKNSPVLDDIIPEVVPMSIAIISGWVILLFRLRGFRGMGPLIVITERIITKDVVRVLVFYGAIFIAFQQAMYIDYRNEKLNMLALYDSGIGGPTGVFTWHLENVHHRSWTQYILFPIFLMTTTVTLLNLMIALMGHSFSKIMEDSKRQWWLQRASIISKIESNEKMARGSWLEHLERKDNIAYERETMNEFGNVGNFKLIMQEERRHGQVVTIVGEQLHL